MRLYHGTVGWSEAERITRAGFTDQDDRFFVPPIAGVHLVDQPRVLSGLRTLVVDIAASETDLVPFELIEDGKPYREWFVPAAWLNRHAIIVAHGEAHSITATAC